MELKLSSVEYVVFDEADRLFEMGFSAQLHEIIRRFPESRLVRKGKFTRHYLFWCRFSFAKVEESMVLYLKTIKERNTIHQNE